MDKRLDGHKSQITVKHHTDPPSWPSWRFQRYKFRGKSGTGFLIPRRLAPEKRENHWSCEEDLNQPLPGEINDTRGVRYSKVPITFRARKAVLCLILKMIRWKYKSTKQNWLTGLWARRCANIQQVLISKFASGPENVPRLCSRIVSVLT